MKKIIPILFFGLGNILIANSQNCTAIFTDNFSSATGWQSEGNGNVNISNGKCNFNNAYDGDYNRVYKNLGITLSDNYWKAECEFSVLSPNPSGNGTDAIILALTAGNLNFISGATTNSETNQDGIAVTLGSPTISDNNMNNWSFIIQEKKGNVRTGSTSVIYANSSISNYYIRLERLANGMAQLSVFSDASFTTHLSGSPITYAINSTITGLNTIQHGVNAGGNPARLIDANLDNDLICQTAASTCNPIFTDAFSSTTGWQSEGNGNVNISNGKCNFNNVYDGDYNRVYKNLGITLSDNYWKAECEFSVLSPNPSGNGTDAIILALTAGNLNFISGVSTNSETNQDGIAVTLGSPAISDNDMNNWSFIIQEKKGNVRIGSTSVIYASSSINNYYIRLERTANGMAQLSVFSDASFTTHLSGSPITYAINSSITGLNTIQHGVNAGGNPARLIDANLDNDLICQNSTAGIADEKNINQILIYPNPSNDIISIEVPKTEPQNYILSIMNLQGQEVINEKIDFQTKHSINVSTLSNGIYILSLRNNNENYVNKIIIQK